MDFCFFLFFIFFISSYFILYLVLYIHIRADDEYTQQHIWNRMGWT